MPQFHVIDYDICSMSAYKSGNAGCGQRECRKFKAHGMGIIGLDAVGYDGKGEATILKIRTEVIINRYSVVRDQAGMDKQNVAHGKTYNLCRS
ncbi:MAG: hypothetical protein GX577_06580 [Leptolinea sp.]|nr:hypothetical protein [Leptolinea sp.]